MERLRRFLLGLLIFLTLLVLGAVGYFLVSSIFITSQEASSQQGGNSSELKTKVFVATVIDAELLSNLSKAPNSNKQNVMLSVEVETESGIRNDNIEVVFAFPNEEFKKPLHIGDKVLIESTSNLEADKLLNFISYYRQDNLLIWTLILIGLFLVLLGFKNNLRYVMVFLIFLVSGLIVLFLYKRSTFLMFGSLFIWQILASYIFALQIFHKRLISIVLTTTVVLAQIISMSIIYFMDMIKLFDVGVFDMFFKTINDARYVMSYTFAIISIYPISIVLSEQLLSEAIKIKHQSPYISRVDMVKNIMKHALRVLNYVFLVFFGLFFSLFVGVVALASEEGYFIQIINSSSISRLLSLGFLLLFNMLVFIPLVTAVIGTFLGNLETHKLITDKNLNKLDL